MPLTLNLPFMKKNECLYSSMLKYIAFSYEKISGLSFEKLGILKPGLQAPSSNLNLKDIESTEPKSELQQKENIYIRPNPT